MDDLRKDKLRKQLNDTHSWPTVFMFKFIMPAEEKKITQVKLLFDESAEVSERKSKTGKYISLTIKEMVMKPDDIFERYEGASKIKDVIAL